MVGTDKPATAGQHCFEFGYQYEMFIACLSHQYIYTYIVHVYTQHITYIRTCRPLAVSLCDGSATLEAVANQVVVNKVC